jgi:dCTP diphosphatase
MDITEIQNQLREFAAEREWEQFHTPKNLVMALSGEAGELTDLFQWKTAEESQCSSLSESEIEEVRQEMADIALYLIRLSDKLEIDLEGAIQQKLKVNAEKYPVNVSKGNATKYSRR